MRVFGSLSCSFLSRGDNSEVLVHGTVAINASLESIENLASLNKLAKHGLVTIKVWCSTERDRELGSSSVLTIVRESELAAFIVSHGQVLVLEAHTKGTDILVAHATSRDAKAALSVMESRAGVRAALSSVTESAEALSGCWLLLSVKLENEIADLLVTLGHSEVDTWVSGIAVVVQAAEATL